MPFTVFSDFRHGSFQSILLLKLINEVILHLESLFETTPDRNSKNNQTNEWAAWLVHD